MTVFRIQGVWSCSLNIWSWVGVWVLVNGIAYLACGSRVGRTTHNHYPFFLQTLKHLKLRVSYLFTSTTCLHLKISTSLAYVTTYWSVGNFNKKVFRYILLFLSYFHLFKAKSVIIIIFLNFAESPKLRRGLLWSDF